MVENDSAAHAAQQVVRVNNAAQNATVPSEHFHSSTWQGKGRSPSVASFPRAAERGNGNRARFRTFGCARVTANDDTSFVIRRSGSQKRQRTRNLSVPVDGAEFLAIDGKARAAGLSRGAFLRACALDTPGPRAQRSPTVQLEALARATAALNKAGSNLNQIARRLNTAGSIGLAHASFGVLTETRTAVAAILDVVGRRVR